MRRFMPFVCSLIVGCSIPAKEVCGTYADGTPWLCAPAGDEDIGETEQALITHTQAPSQDYGLPCNDWLCQSSTLTASVQQWNGPTNNYALPPISGSDHIVGVYIAKPSANVCNSINTVSQVFFDFYLSVGPQNGQIFTIWEYPPIGDQFPHYQDCAFLGTDLFHVSLSCEITVNLTTQQAWTKRDLGCDGGNAPIMAWSFFRYPNPYLLADRVFDVRMRVIHN